VTSYSVRFSTEAEAAIGRLDKRSAQRMLDRIKWLCQHVDDVEHVALSGHLRRAFKLRVGDYRVIYELNRRANVLTVRDIGHRSEVYRR
jgi:mRNA interferase RelE/StbE